MEVLCVYLFPVAICHVVSDVRQVMTQLKNPDISDTENNLPFGFCPSDFCS